jgi:hypothetical protein
MDKDIYNELDGRSVRWLRKYFFDDTFAPITDFSVSNLIDSTRRERLLRGCLEKITSPDIIKLYECLWKNPENKQEIILFKVQSQDSHSDEFCSIIKNISQFELIETIDLSLEKMDDIIRKVETHRAKVVSAIFFFANTDFKSEEILTKMAFVVGSVGKNNAKIIYAKQDKKFECLTESINIDCIYSKELGLEFN